MKTCLECLPCLGKNAVDVAKRINATYDVKKGIVSYALKMLSECDCSMPPPFYAADILCNAQKIAGNSTPDPYAEEKHRSSNLANEIIAELKHNGTYNPDDFESRLRLAIAGNVLDFGIYGDMDLSLALKVIENAFSKPIDCASILRLKEKMDNAKSIFYVLDNCGEAVFDREFIAPYRNKVVLAVRGTPVFNDVTIKELQESGLESFTAGVVENLSNIPGSILEFAGEVFCGTFWKSELVIAKGQGNFECLNDIKHNIAFLFMAKCPVVCKLINAETQSLHVRLSQS